MQTFRAEVETLELVDRVVKSKGTSRAKWYRMAILNQLTQDLAEMDAEPEPEPEEPESLVHWPTEDELAEHRTPLIPAAPVPVPELEEPEDNIVDLALRTAHHIDCIKSIDHEGACLD